MVNIEIKTEMTMDDHIHNYPFKILTLGKISLATTYLRAAQHRQQGQLSETTDCPPMILSPTQPSSPAPSTNTPRNTQLLSNTDTITLLIQVEKAGEDCSRQSEMKQRSNGRRASTAARVATSLTTSMKFKLFCGEGNQPVKWLGLVACQKLAPGIPRRQRSKKGCFFRPMAVLMKDGMLVDPEIKVNACFKDMVSGLFWMRTNSFHPQVDG
jgi:hypothetical protein